MTGNQTVFHGLGDTPKALLLWGIGKDNESFRLGYNLGMGVTDGTTSRSIAATSKDAAGVTDTSRRQTSSLFTQLNPGEVTIVDGSFVSWDAYNFTINWTTNNASDWDIGYVIIGGDEVSAKVIGWNTPVTTGNYSVTGVGFQPDAVLHLTNGKASTTLPSSHTAAGFGLGAMDENGNQWANFTLSDDLVSTSNSNRGQRTDSALYSFTGSGTVDMRTTYTSMDTDGFTVNFATAPASAIHVPSLAIKGASPKVGSFTKSTGSAPVEQSITGVGYKPGAVLLSSVQTSQTNFGAHARFGIGATDGKGGQMAVAFQDTDALGTSSVDSVQKATKDTSK